MDPIRASELLGGLLRMDKSLRRVVSGRLCFADDYRCMWFASICAMTKFRRCYFQSFDPLTRLPLPVLMVVCKGP